MGYNLFGSFTLAEAKDVGRKIKVVCIGDRGYSGKLTCSREYEVEITPCILPMSPLCKLIGDDGVMCECHLERFEKIVNV